MSPHTATFQMQPGAALTADGLAAAGGKCGRFSVGGPVPCAAGRRLHVAGPVPAAAGPRLRGAGPVPEAAGPWLRSAGPVPKAAGPRLRGAGSVPKAAGLWLRSAGTVPSPAGPRFRSAGTGFFPGARGSGFATGGLRVRVVRRGSPTAGTQAATIGWQARRGGPAISTPMLRPETEGPR